MATTLKPKRTSRRQAERSGREISLAAKSGETSDRPIWETVAEIGSQISDEDWETVPNDSSINYKHHLYGAPTKHV